MKLEMMLTKKIASGILTRSVEELDDIDQHRVLSCRCHAAVVLV